MTETPARGTPVYRGVAVSHPGFGAALVGTASPRGGIATRAEHNLGNTESQYTSWTTDRHVAERWAGPGGALMEIDLAEVAGRWALSPDVFWESEILIQGSVTGARVLRP